MKRLTQDFVKEGWLWKTGPRSSDGYKKRWFTLDNRKLMYHDEPLVRVYFSEENYHLEEGT